MEVAVLSNGESTINVLDWDVNVVVNIKETIIMI